MNISNRGFTLLELMMAITIFSTLSILSFAGLNQIQKAQIATEKVMKSLADIQKALRRFELDLTHTVHRNIFNESKTTVLSFIASTEPFPTLELTRAGVDPLINRVPSSLMRIGYQYENETLYRLAWPVVDRSNASVPSRYPILKNISDLKMVYYDAKKGKHKQWPNRTSEKPTLSPSGVPIVEAPVAIEISFISKTSGKFRKLIPLNNYLHNNLRFEPFKK